MKTPREKLEEAVQRHLVLRAKTALEHVKRIQQPGSAEGDALWKQATVRDRVNLKLVELAASTGRAKGDATHTTNVFGVVVMPQRIEDPAAWEAQARQVGAPIRKVIEATADDDKGGTE